MNHQRSPPKFGPELVRLILLSTGSGDGVIESKPGVVEVCSVFRSRRCYTGAGHRLTAKSISPCGTVQPEIPRLSCIDWRQPRGPHPPERPAQSIYLGPLALKGRIFPRKLLQPFHVGRLLLLYNEKTMGAECA